MQSFFKAPMHTKCRDPPKEYDVRHDLTARDVRRWRYRESCRRLGRQKTTDSTAGKRHRASHYGELTDCYYSSGGEKRSKAIFPFQNPLKEARNVHTSFQISESQKTLSSPNLDNQTSHIRKALLTGYKYTAI